MELGQRAFTVPVSAIENRLRAMSAMMDTNDPRIQTDASGDRYITTEDLEAYMAERHA